MSSPSRSQTESRLPILYKSVTSVADAASDVCDIFEKGFTVINGTRYLNDELTSIITEKKRRATVSDDDTVFTMLDAAISFFLTDSLCTEDLLPILNAFLPLYTECGNFILSSSQFCKNEYESAWKNFKIEFSKAEKSIIPFNLRRELRDYTSSSDVLRKQLPQIRPEIDQHMNIIDIRISQISSFISSPQQADLIHDVKDAIIKFRLHISNYISVQNQGKVKISPSFFLYSKVLEEAVDNASTFYKLHELVKGLSSDMDVTIPNRKKITPQIQRSFLISSVHLFGIIVKQLSMVSIPEINQKDLFELFSQIYSISCALQVQKEGNLCPEWKDLEVQLSKCNLKPNANEEEEAMSNLRTAIKNNAGDYRTVLYDFRKIEKLYSEAKESLKDIGKLNELTIFMLDVARKVDSVETQRCLDGFKVALSTRFLIGHAYSICEKIQQLIQYFAGPSSSINGNPEKSAQSLLECIQNLKLFEISETQQFVYAYTQYLEYVQIVSKIDPEKGKELLSKHPTDEMLRQHMKPSERFQIALNDVKTREESGSAYIEASRLRVTSFPTLAWIERCTAFYLYSTGHTLESQNAIFSFELISAFFRSAAMIRQNFSPSESTQVPKREDNSGGKIPSFIKCVLGIVQKANANGQKEMLAALEPLVFYNMYEIDTDIDTAINTLANSIALPEYVDVLQKCYDTIDLFCSSSRAIPELTSISKEAKIIISNIFSGKLPGNVRFELRMPDNVQALLNPKEIHIFEAGIENIGEFINGCLSVFPLLPILKINMDSFVACFALANHVMLIRNACQSILKSGAVRPERTDEVRNLIDDINDVFSWRMMDVYRRKDQFQQIMESFWNMGAIDRNDYLALYINQVIPGIERLISQRNYLSAMADVPKLLKQVAEIAAQYRMTRNRITLLNITDLINIIKDRVSSAERKVSVANTVLEASLIIRQLSSLNTRIAMIRTVSQLEYFPNVSESFTTKVPLMINIEKLIQMTGQGDPVYEKLKAIGKEYGSILSESFSDILEYIKDLTPEDLIDARIKEAEKLKSEMEKEIEFLENEIEALPGRANDARTRAIQELDAFEAELARAEEATNENQARLEELSAKRSELSAELEKAHAGKSGEDVLTSDVPSVVRMLLNDDVSLEDFGDGRKTTEADFIAAQLQEALRTNLRLKKSLEVLDFPREKALFSAQEFAAILDKFTPPAGYDTPFVPRRANEGASLRQTLKELNAERDSLVRQVVALNSTPTQREHDTDDLYAEMVALSTADVSGRRTHKESFLEFADVSDQFFLEVANETESLEQEILELKSGHQRKQEDPAEVRSFLLKRLEKNVQGPH